MHSRLYAAVLLSLSLGACETKSSSVLSASTEPKIELGLNDVAIILPYDTVPALLKRAPTINGGAHDFVSASLLKEISSILVDDRAIHAQEDFAFGRVGDGDFESDATRIGSNESEAPYRLVSLRVDPCVNELVMTSSDSCEANVRLVFQPLLLEGGQVTAKDSNIHAIYRIEARDFEAFLDGLRQLRSEAGAAPRDEALLPHPVIAREGENSAYFNGLVKLLSSQLNPDRLKRIAFFGDTDPNQQGHWPMLAFNVDKGKVVRVPLDKVGKQDGETQKFVQRLHGNHEHLEDPLPRGTIEATLFPPMTLTGEEDPETMQKAIQDFMQTKYKNSFTVDNPRIHDPANADCASCHVAVTQRIQLEPEMRSMGIEIPKGPKFVSERWNLADNVTADFSKISLQIFSYFRTRPKIAPRAVNDAAHSADLINRSIFLKAE